MKPVVEIVVEMNTDHQMNKPKPSLNKNPTYIQNTHKKRKVESKQKYTDLIFTRFFRFSTFQRLYSENQLKNSDMWPGD